MTYLIIFFSSEIQTLNAYADLQQGYMTWKVMNVVET